MTRKSARPDPPVDLDLVIDHGRIARKYPRCRRGYLDDTVGVFLSGKHAPGERVAFVLLGNLYQEAQDIFGPDVPEDFLTQAVIGTTVHEVLHGYIRSGSRSPKKRDRREHQAMARLMQHVGLDPHW